MVMTPWLEQVRDLRLAFHCLHGEFCWCICTLNYPTPVGLKAQNVLYKLSKVL